MALLHLMHADGGFLCGDTDIGLAEYAYPSSVYAVAAQRDPVRVMHEMLDNHAAQLRYLDNMPHLAARNERWLAELLAGTPEGREATERCNRLIDAGIAAQDRGAGVVL